MDRLKPLLIHNAVEQRCSLFAAFERKDSLPQEDTCTSIDNDTADASFASKSSNPTLCSTPFRFPIAVTRPGPADATRPQSLHSDDDSSILSNLRSRRFSEATFTSNYDVGWRDSELIASTPKIVPTDAKTIDRRAMQFIKSEEILSMVKTKDEAPLERSRASHLGQTVQEVLTSPPSKINYGRLFTALCITDPTALSHPIKLTTPSYKVSHLGLLQLGTGGIESETESEDTDTWNITQELGADTRPKFLLEWRGTLISFIPGRGKMYLASQIDITSVLRGMAAYDLSHLVELRDNSQSSSLPAPASSSTALTAFTEMFADVNSQFRRYFVLQQKPHSRLPRRSPVASRFTPISPPSAAAPSPRSPASPRALPSLMDYAIIFASPRLHRRGADATYNFVHCPRSVMDALEKKLRGTETFELPVKWGLAGELLWLVAVLVSDGVARWWVCFLLEWDDEIF